MILNNEKLNEINVRLEAMVLSGKTTREKAQSITDHLEESLKHGETEVISHFEMTDEELIKYRIYYLFGKKLGIIFFN